MPKPVWAYPRGEPPLQPGCKKESFFKIPFYYSYLSFLFLFVETASAVKRIEEKLEAALNRIEFEFNSLQESVTILRESVAI